MKDHHLADDANARYLARRSYGLNAMLPPPIVHGTLSGGLGRDQLLGDFATVQVTVGPWAFPQMTDSIVLHWGDQWIQEFPVTDSHDTQLLSIPGIDIAGGPLGDGDHYSGEGTQAIWYEVRADGGAMADSATTQVIVKTTRPGGQDPLPGSYVNDNLVTPVAEPNPVEQDATEVTFSVKPWKNIASDDKLVLVVAGIFFPFPAITDIAAIQTLTLAAEQVAAIGGGSKTPVSYQITDRVGNLSGYAPFLTLNVWMETGDHLEMLEVADNEGAFIEGAIDPAMSKGKARVPRYTDWVADESVTVVLEGTDSNGQEHTTQLGPKVWEPTTFYLDFDLPNEVLRPLAGGIVRVHYQTSTNKTSFRRIYMVSPLPETGLPPVTVRGEQGGELPLDGIGDYVNIVVPDSEALVDFARVTLIMEGSGAGGAVHEEETRNIGEGEGHTPYTFAWLKARVTPLLERTATFRYSVRTLDAAHASARGIRDSEPHDLLIKENSSGGQLPAPIVVDLVDDAVSPTLPTLKLSVPGGAESKPGRKVVTTVVGLTTVTHTDVIFDQGETLHVDFPGWPALNDGAKATASYTIDDTPSKQATFAVGAVGSWPAGEDFEDVPLGTIHAPLDIGTMVISGKLDTGLVLIDKESEHSPYVTGQALMCRLADEYGMLLTLPEGFSHVRVGIFSDVRTEGYSTGVGIDALDADDNILGRLFANANTTMATWYEFHTLNNHKIKKIRVHQYAPAGRDRGYVKLDNFTFTR